MDTKATQPILRRFKYGEDVFIYVEYKGIVKGIVKAIDNDTTPFKYVVNADDEIYKVSQVHIFETWRDANSFITSSVVDHFTNMCDKLGIDMSDCKMRINVFIKQPKYNKSQVENFIGRNVDVKLDNGQTLSGILTYIRYYHSKDGVVSENFYYVKSSNTNCFTSFKLNDIEKIKEKE